MRKLFGVLAAVATIGTVVASALPASAETTLRVSNWLPPSHPIVRDILAPWGEQVRVDTPNALESDF